jgi:hypothetical protein
VEAAIAARGYGWAVRASVHELATVSDAFVERPRLTIVG